MALKDAHPMKSPMVREFLILAFIQAPKVNSNITPDFVRFRHTARTSLSSAMWRLHESDAYGTKPVMVPSNG